MNRKARRDDIVTIDTFTGSIWRVLAVSGGLAHLTCLTSGGRVELREIPVDRLTIREVFL
jgi:hypothetical protein